MRRRARPRRAGVRYRSGRCRCTRRRSRGPSWRSRRAARASRRGTRRAAPRSAGPGTRAGTCTRRSLRSPAAFGLVKVSSVGTFGVIFTPSGVSSWPPSQRVRARDRRRATCPARGARGRVRPSFVSFAERRASARRVVEPAGRALAVFVGEPAEPEDVLGQAALALERRELRIDLSRPEVRRPARARPAGTHVEVRAAERLAVLGRAHRVESDLLRRDPVEIPGLALADDRRTRARAASRAPACDASPTARARRSRRRSRSRAARE